VGEERESSPRNKSRRWAKLTWFFPKLKNCLLTNTFAKQQLKKTHGTRMNQWNPFHSDRWAPTEWAFSAQKRGCKLRRSKKKKKKEGGKAYQFCFAVFRLECLGLPHILAKKSSVALSLHHDPAILAAHRSKSVSNSVTT
jgi:hypothetical protein